MATLMLIVCACTAGDNHAPPWTEHDVDLIELNHRYDPDSKHANGEPMFSQIILWRRVSVARYDERGRYIGTIDRFHTCGFVLLSHWQSHGCPTLLRLGSANVFRVQWGPHRVQAPLFRESRTVFDPEQEDKRLYPEVYRPNLLQPLLQPLPPAVP